MPESIADLLKSKATIWIAPVGTAQPDETTVAAGAAWGGAWVKLGWTKEPVKMKYETEEMEFMVDQILGPLDRRKINEHVTFETILAEATALNLAYASGGESGDVTSTAAGASQKAFEEIQIGGDPFMEKYAVGFEGILYDSTDTAQPVRVFMTRATLFLNGELEFSQANDDYVGIPCQVKGLADTGNSNRMFKWQRVTAPASS